jgi:hypothetical protein
MLLLASGVAFSLSPSLMKARLKSLSVAQKKKKPPARSQFTAALSAAAKAARTALDVFDLAAAAAAYFTACPLHHKSPSAATTCICMTVPPL